VAATISIADGRDGSLWPIVDVAADKNGTYWRYLQIGHEIAFELQSATLEEAERESLVQLEAALLAAAEKTREALERTVRDQEKKQREEADK